MKRKRSKEKITVYCAVCNKPKIITPCRYKEGKKFFCSPAHQQEAQKGRTLSEETKNKISKTKGGISTEKRVCRGCGIQFEVPKWSKKVYHNRQCSSAVIGKLPTKSWRQGLSSNDPKILQANQKQSRTLKARYKNNEIKPWNDGLTSETDERMRKLNEKLTKMRNTEGPWKDAWREAMSKGQVRAHSEGKYPHTFTKPEHLTWEYLEATGRTVKAYNDRSDDDPPNTWYHQYPFEESFIPDFASPD